jgi:FAD/FMN-containing dehydrogenase
MRDRYTSWGRYPRSAQSAVRLNWRSDSLPPSERSFLSFGNGRSYGDSCLNEGGVLLDARGLDRFISFDSSHGVLRCEAGVLLSELLRLTVPHGWFLPVTPGTKFVTVGGAIANDVHGKNHHRAGSFGCHVRRFELLRSDGQRLTCSAEENAGFYRATIGGLGLTGVITWAEITLKPIVNAAIQLERVRFANLDAFFELSEEADRGYEYSVAWIDCLANGTHLGRGIFSRANHAGADCPETPAAPRHHLGIPVELPVSVINRPIASVFNRIYYGKHREGTRASIVHYDPFFYPLDGVQHWNRLYGPDGFLQYQCVIPGTNGKEAIRDILNRTGQTGISSVFAVLKVFGDQPSRGILSFPRPGITLAMDFPYRGSKTLAFLDGLDRIVMAVGGAVNPAKDARMSGETFAKGFPQWATLEAFRDPNFSSSFWRRVTRG